ncbi:methyltransferase domain-containing protein [Methylobacterium sp. Leaf94]|uniref:methyltransferase domain-containing protein n=1 Tax=Methylobacterium sp. Leaf94 TaxID=1736250 RepID=UPI000A4A56AE|nr:methyltransferase domain-containing protein [Methylobacterium sp. Leaf94]
MALDCACGTGQLSVLLADRFEHVIATDASTAQVAPARPHARVAYSVAPARAERSAGGARDLVPVAQAAHWLELPTFYTEVRRVAHPGAHHILGAAHR